MSTRLLFYCFAFVSLSFSATAQVYEPGYIVRSTGDTLRGEIENGFWKEPPAYIRFRPTPESASQLFKPRQLRRVSFTAGRAFRYEGLPIDHAARAKVGDLPYENRPDVQVDSLLAEILVDGPVSLVRVEKFERPTHYLLLQAGHAPLDLSERKYLRRTVDLAWLLTDGNNYRGQLSVYFGNCPAAHSAVQKAPFTADGLMAVVQAYNEACAHQPGRNLLELAHPRRKVAFQGGLLAGVRYNRIESGSLHYEGACTDCQPHPFAGLYSELLQPGRNIAVHGELSLSRFHSKGAERTYVPLTGAEGFNEFVYDAWLTTARIGMRYFMSLPKEQLAFIGVSYELNFISGAETTPLNGGAAPTDPQLYFATPVLTPSVSAGWRRDRFTLSLDGQMYASSDMVDSGSITGPKGMGQVSDFLGPMFFGTNFAARLGLSYRLGRNPDARKPAATH
ncbi:hypothetical protein [Hymenobacter properus]|uniref:DUF5723 domain-containing protein n=1 Tax=Hymenobacter properus TaxID=2791026 RepID=A0A931FKG4_9BACT|nr:hypothetical protein [Hymenobacter properus]MBF9140971.1 hypothetical protein [Hymenobacter properus]MBR7719780.1 hypothetical protein [Microvirga sp. SRT04]